MTPKQNLIKYHGFHQYPYKQNILINKYCSIIKLDKNDNFINMKVYQIKGKPHVYLQYNHKNKNIIQKPTSLAEIMVKTFFKYNHKTQVIIHLDKDFQNCRLSNLEIVPKSYYEKVYKYTIQNHTQNPIQKLTQEYIENEMLKRKDLTLSEQLKKLGYI